MQYNAKGTVSSIVYNNTTNGYTVLMLDSDCGDKITCVGYVANVAIGERLAIEGHAGYHNKYGEQLIIDSYTIDSPTSREGIIRYLASGLIKGVGEATATNIYNMFGEDTIGVIESNPAKLSRVKGISTKKATEIGRAISDLKQMQEHILYLAQYDISTNLAIKIYNTYTTGTKSVVSVNPYKLIEDIDGVGFSTADKIALSMGHDGMGEFRLRAGLLYTLKDSADKEGNTYLTLDSLVDRCSKLLGTDLRAISDRVDNLMTKMVLEPTIKLFDIGSDRAVSLIRHYAVEHSVAVSLIRLARDAKTLAIDLDSLVSQFEKVNKISFHHSQKDAVVGAINNGVTVITGGPGTGKTTIIKCIADILIGKGMTVEFCAPTGRASKRMSMACGRDAKTIHRLLGFDFSAGKSKFVHNANNPLECDVVIVDEMSMVDANIMYNLLKAVANGTRLVLVGDKDQLPSVGAGNVLSDIIKSGILPVYCLTHIYRQSDDSLIVSNAHLVNDGKMPIINNSSRDFFVMHGEDMTAVLDTVVELVSSRLPKFTGVSSRNIQVLGALKSGVAGIDQLNKSLQATVNRESIAKREVSVGKHMFREGDRVMQTVNNYELPFVRTNEHGHTEDGTGVFNGDIGFVTNIDKASGVVEVTLDDDRVARYSNMELEELMLAYAVTIHKSQGSEFDVVVIPLLSGPPSIINRNLLYTAITRAKKLVVLVGSKRILSMMVHNNYIATRTTLLNKFLVEEKAKYDKFFGGAVD